MIAFIILLAIVSGANSGWTVVQDGHQEFQSCGEMSAGVHFEAWQDGQMLTHVPMQFDRIEIHHAGAIPVYCYVYSSRFKFLEPGHWNLKGVSSDPSGIGLNYYADLDVYPDNTNYLPYVTGWCESTPCDPLPDPMGFLAYPLAKVNEDRTGALATVLLMGGIVAALVLLGRREKRQ